MYYLLLQCLSVRTNDLIDNLIVSQKFRHTRCCYVNWHLAGKGTQLWSKSLLRCNVVSQTIYSYDNHSPGPGTRFVLLKVTCSPRPREGIKPGTNARNSGPKSGTKFCQQNIAIKHACIKLKFGWNVDYKLFFEMHISIFLHLPYFYYMHMKYRTMSWNTDPGPTFSVLTMSRNS